MTILCKLIDLEDGKPLDEDAIKKKMEEINEMFDVSGNNNNNYRCRKYVFLILNTIV